MNDQIASDDDQKADPNAERNLFPEYEFANRTATKANAPT